MNQNCIMIINANVQNIKNISLSDSIDRCAKMNMAPVSISKRQVDCLYNLVKGMTLKQIGRTLNLSSRTVEHYLDAVKIKLNCHSRAELITKALQIKIIRDKL